jgi:hypothetical protein
MDAQKTPSGPSFVESHYEEVFHIFAAIAALFGYPPPPPPGKLRAGPEWNEFVAKHGTEVKIPDTEFYGNSPYERKMVRDEAHHALHLLDERIKECKRNKDKLGINGLKYIQGTMKVFLAMVEGGIPEKEGWWAFVPVIGPIVRKQREQKRAYEQALKKAESITRGMKPVKEKPRFFDTKNDKQLRVIYNTIRQYIVDENLSAEGSDVKVLGKQTFTQYKMKKESGGSTTEAMNFNKWLGVFFSDLFKAM